MLKNELTKNTIQKGSNRGLSHPSFKYSPSWTGFCLFTSDKNINQINKN